MGWYTQDSTEDTADQCNGVQTGRLSRLDPDTRLECPKRVLDARSFDEVH